VRFKRLLPAHGIHHAIAASSIAAAGEPLNRTARTSDRERMLLDSRGALAAPSPRLARQRGFVDLPVTQREREVLERLAAGKTDREIGEILGMSPRTVQKHLQHIYEKLGVETRTAAVMRALGK
jgi:DNA-binding CsgD family transcriptional regulator